MYGETRNMTKTGSDHGFANKTQNIEAVVQYQFDFGLRPSLGYVYSQGKDRVLKTARKALMQIVSITSKWVAVLLQQKHERVHRL
jgi:predicted porin